MGEFPSRPTVIDSCAVMPNRALEGPGGSISPQATTPCASAPIRVLGRFYKAAALLQKLDSASTLVQSPLPNEEGAR